jgi:hypothetical protein
MGLILLPYYDSSNSAVTLRMATAVLLLIIGVGYVILSFIVNAPRPRALFTLK